MVRLWQVAGIRGHERWAAWVALGLLGAGLVVHVTQRSEGWLEPSGNSAVRRFMLAPMAPVEGAGDVHGFSQDPTTEEDGGESIPADYAASQGNKFYIYPGSIFGNASHLWEPVPEVARRAACFVDVLEAHDRRTQDPEEASLFIVPMYRLSHILSSGNAKAIAAALGNLGRSLHSSIWHIKYGGANHVFAFAESLNDGARAMVVSALNVDLRSFWAQVGSQHSPTSWRCPNRYVPIKLPKTPKPCPHDKSLMAMGRDGRRGACTDGSSWCKEGVDCFIIELFFRTRGKGVWNCTTTTKTPTDIVGELMQDGTLPKGFVRGAYLDHGHKMMACFIPKCGSTVMKMMQKRQMGLSTWNARDARRRWKGLVVARKNATLEELHEMVDGVDWLKVAVVRDPVIRCLSGYLQKIVEHEEYWYIHWKNQRKPSFEEFVQTLYSYPHIRGGNVHFIEQSAFCGFRYVDYNFVAKVETLHDDYKELLERLDLWELYGASGWGEDGSQSFLQVFEPSAHHPQRLESSKGDPAVAKHYTADLLEKVYEMYREDFDRFGYSIEKWRRLVNK